MFGIKVEGQWQGLLLALSEGHHSSLARSRQPLVYIDFIEAAPWNWDIKILSREGRFRGVGLQLIEMAVRWSVNLGHSGRIGLHSLSQSESYYTGRCHMAHLGVDASYQGLSYFELSETAAQEFLRRKQ